MTDPTRSAASDRPNRQTGLGRSRLPPGGTLLRVAYEGRNVVRVPAEAEAA